MPPFTNDTIISYFFLHSRTVESVDFSSTDRRVKKILSMALFGNFRQYTVAALWYPDFTMPHGRVATRSVARGHVHKNSAEKQNPGSIDFQCPGESKWRDSAPRRNLNRRDCPLDSKESHTHRGAVATALAHRARQRSFRLRKPPTK